jgi:Lrp/AsnC family transcriptional regulator, leucine-responsive regulatory protein
MALKAIRSIDPTDWKIISELELDARQSFSELGRKVGLSQPAAAERVKALESAGVIRGYRVDIDREKLGFTITAFIRMETEGDKCYGLQRIVAQLPEVLECNRVTGEGSYMIRAALKSVTHLEALIDRLLPFGSPSTSIVLSTPLPLRSVACVE